MNFTNSEEYRGILGQFSDESIAEGLIVDLLKIVKINETEGFSKFEDFIFYIQQILWNELDILVYPKEEVLLLSLIGLKVDELDLVDVKVLINKYEQQGQVSSLDILLFAIIFTKYIDSSELTIDKIFDNFSEFTSNNLDLKELISILNHLETPLEIDELQALLSAFSVFDKTNEFPDDFVLQYIDNESLYHVGRWLPRKFHSQLVNYMIEKLVTVVFEDSTFTKFEDIIDTIESKPILEDFPINHSVYGDNIANFPARAIDMNELSNVPSKFIKDWAPKFVYSKPELSDKVKIYFPGGRHIGHSAILIKSTYGSILMDYGLSVVNNSTPKWLPLLEKVDAILLSHAHMDHSGALPLLYGKLKTTPWFATEQTKLMCEMLWGDTQKIVNRNYSGDALKANRNLKRLVAKSSVINTLQNYNELEIGKAVKLTPDIEFTTKDATHLFGSVGFELSIGGKKILYTGDFNMDKGASFESDADISLFDSTYFERYQSYPSPQEGLKQALENSSRILIPAFSMGRTQEIMFELKHLNAEKDWKIFLTGMGGRLTNRLNLTVGPSGGGKDTGISIVNTVNPEEFTEKTIVISGQGMLQAGTSRNLFEATANDDNTGIVMCGYQAPNTLGYHLLDNHPYLTSKYRQQVSRVKISGHTTAENLDKFMDNLQGRKVMVHTPYNSFENRTRDDVETPMSQSMKI